MAKRVRVVTGGSKDSSRPTAKQTRRAVVPSENPQTNSQLTSNEIRARLNRRYATATTFGGLQSSSGVDGMLRTADVANSGANSFYSPQLSTDFLEKPQNLRERRAFYRFFYNTNEIIGQAIDIHSTLPLSKIKLVPPKGKNYDQNMYVYRFFEKMCEDMKLFKTLIDITHEYMLFGNCVAKHADIPILGGRKRAEDVHVGDYVLTNKGRYRKITKSTRRPCEEINIIKCWKDFRDLPLSDEHPVEVLRDGEFVFIPTDDLSKDDYIRVTWPAGEDDVNWVALSYPPEYSKVDGGYERVITHDHPRNSDSLKARKYLVSWLGSLTDPVVRTRRDIAEKAGVSEPTLGTVIAKMDSEIDSVFHKRVGASGWQKGSQVVWYPLDPSGIDVGDTYVISRSKFIGAVDGFNLTEDMCYLVGFWMGDGTLSRDSSRRTWGRGLWQISFSDKEIGNVERVESILKSVFGESSIKRWSSNGITNVKVISNPAFVEWWADNFGETSFGKNSKRIPEWFVGLPKNKLLSFIAGAIDSDGCSSVSGLDRKSVVKISMSSRNVMDSVRDICFKLGSVVNYGVQPERDDVRLPNGEYCSSRKQYYVTASDENSCRILMSSATKSIPEDAEFCSERYYKRIQGDLAFKVKEISRELYNDFVYNFEVEEDHTYQVAGFSTHNCFIFAEEDDSVETMDPSTAGRKKEESRQRSEFLKEKYQIKDKDPLYKGWKKLLVLPPDQVRVRKLPLTDDVSVEYVPDPETKRWITGEQPMYPDQQNSMHKLDVPLEIQEKVRMSGVIPLDTDPNTGSHVFHFARKKSQYEPLGVSIVERCINTLVLMDKLRQAQTSIASRHMTPMRIVWAEDLSTADVDNLREQVDMALVDPDFSIIANYEIHWEEMGSNGRLLDIEADYEGAMNRLMAGLGVTREVLTGEGTYTGSRISLEIMNTQYLLYRELLQEYVENNLFKPVAKKKGFVEYDKYGNETVLYPRLSFSRLAIRDNEQFFDAAFQLYQKGSISIDLILDILNIDPVSTRQKIEEDAFTVNDSQFNELFRNIYANAAQNLIEGTDLVEKLAKYLKLERKPEEGKAPGEERFSSEQGNGKVSEPEFQQKMAKLYKYFKNNPKALERAFR